MTLRADLIRFDPGTFTTERQIASKTDAPEGQRKLSVNGIGIATDEIPSSKLRMFATESIFVRRLKDAWGSVVQRSRDSW